ncbi:hypothetical protein HYH03_002307 [Edaphochlamys debaryana]|uniref:CobW C-terminal domain-containing protein n=1 Tax=Edaphochlamys debaryana TaxID=47281 RepID=A0A835YCD1_9CHLO|nr:hypothetical protein HYH03_002307 [Edaphochlamys debaryana]|eukprot:KAG2500026.1 hypothetical protein HYH03_002307 [Edaphochlamys debaryana]
MAAEEHQVNLVARYEARLLSGASSKPTVIPAVVITGFLGSGKTTLVQHILRNRGSLRIAVLVNEVGRVDVDSDLVNAKQGNAALGLPAADLSGGCVCCSRSEDLEAALRRLRAPAGGGAGLGGGGADAAPCDYLLVETSGAADAGPLAEALVAGGFRLDCVVAVVDAEAGPDALRQPVARAQVGCADVVVLNKCDLVAGGPLGAGPVPGGGRPGGLGALSDLEDELARLAPGVRVVRARFGEVPLTSVLDVVPVEQAAGAEAGPGAAPGANGQQPSGVAASPAAAGGGEVGFMSHEATPAAPPGGAYRLNTGPLTADGLAIGSSRHAKRRAPPLQQPPPPRGGPGRQPSADAAPSTTTAGSSHHHNDDNTHTHTHGHDHSHSGPHAGPGPGPASHATLHAGFHTESLTASQPARLAAFAEFVLRRLVTEPALIRSKGVLWFGDRRDRRFTFHLSGRRRVECSAEGPWDGPPGSTLVFIGSDPAAMRSLAQAFRADVLGETPQHAPHAEQPHDGADPAQHAAQHGAQQGAQHQERHGAHAHGHGEPCGPHDHSGAEGHAGAGTTADAATGTGDGTGAHDHGHPNGHAGAKTVGAEGAGCAGASDAELVAAAAAALVREERLELLPPTAELLAAAGGAAAAAAPGSGGEGAGGERPGPTGGVSAAATNGSAAAAGAGGRLVCFSARGSPLHGIQAEELNAELQRRANVGGQVLLVGVTAPGTISAVTHVQSRDRVVSLILPLASDPDAARRQAQAVLDAAEPLLRRAYAHVHNCKCDAAGAALSR